MAIGALFVIGAATIIAPSLDINKQTTLVQSKTELVNEGLTNIKSWASGNWNSLLALATGTANTYYLNTANSPFTAATGTESISQTTNGGTTVYTRYFYLTDIYRDSNGNATTTGTGNSYDPSTKLVVLVVSASTTPMTASTTVSFYLTRNSDDDISQTSWAGGSGQATPVTVIGTSYAASTNIAISASGTLQLSANTNSCIQ